MTGRVRCQPVAAALVAVLGLGACGGDSGGGPGPTSSSSPVVSTAAPTSTTAATGPTTAPERFTPGDLRFRLVNLLDRPVDLYARTSGLVRAFPVGTTAPGEVSDLVAPPDEGSFTVLEAGADDATCVIDCPHILLGLTADPVYGPIRTVVLAEVDGRPQPFDLWEDPPATAPDAANAMPAADPANALVVVTAIAVPDIAFGLRVSSVGTPGCQASNLENILVGGTSTPAFSLAGPTTLRFHDNTDDDCSGTPVGEPAVVDRPAGSRTHLILSGTRADLRALLVPFVR